MKKLIFRVLILGCMAALSYYVFIKDKSLEETYALPDLSKSNLVKDEGEEGKVDEEYIRKTISVIKGEIKGDYYSYRSLYDLLGERYTKEQAISVAKEFVYDDNLEVSLIAIEILLKLNYDGDLESIVMGLIEKNKKTSYLQSLLSLSSQYRLNNVDQIVNYFIDNKLYTSRSNLGNIIKKASKEKQKVYLNAEVADFLHPLHKKRLLLELGVADYEDGYAGLLSSKYKTDNDLIEDGGMLLQINEMHPDVVSDATIVKLLKIVEGVEEGNGNITTFIRDYVSSEKVSQSYLENILIKKDDKSICEQVLVSLLVAFPESKIAKDYLISELNNVTNVIGPNVKYRLAALLDDPYVNTQSPPPKSKYETPNSSTHWKLRVHQKDRSPYIWIHNYIKDYDLLNN